MQSGIFLSEFLRFTPQYLPTGVNVVSFGDGWQLEPHLRTPWWILFSNGPDRNHGFTPTNPDGTPSVEFDIIQRVIDSDTNIGPFADVVYDATNGTLSAGNIWRTGGDGLNAAGRFMTQSGG